MSENINKSQEIAYHVRSSEIDCQDSSHKEMASNNRGKKVMQRFASQGFTFLNYSERLLPPDLQKNKEVMDKESMCIEVMQVN